MDKPNTFWRKQIKTGQKIKKKKKVSVVWLQKKEVSLKEPKLSMKHKTTTVYFVCYTYLMPLMDVAVKFHSWIPFYE